MTSCTRPPLPPHAMIAPDDAEKRVWDAVVVGAGPAGALCARQLAIHRVAVLLVDKAAFPRGRLCGGCLNGAAVHVLHQAGLGDLINAP